MSSGPIFFRFAGKIDWGLFCGGFKLDIVCNQLDFASGDVVVDHRFFAFDDFACDDDYAFELDVCAGLEEGARGMDDDLCATIVITEVNEENAAVVALVIYPSAQADDFAIVFGAQCATCMCSELVHKNPLHIIISFLFATWKSF